MLKVKEGFILLVGIFCLIKVESVTANELKGKLQIKVRYARDLTGYDFFWTNPDPYVKVDAKMSGVGAESKSSRRITNTRNPNWKQWINYGSKAWTTFDIQVFDHETLLRKDTKLSNKQRIMVEPGCHKNLRHKTYGNGFLVFDYNFIVDGTGCSTNPCRNGGICVEGCNSYTCECPPNYKGTNCERFIGNLVVTALYAENLGKINDFDRDAYMRLVAVDKDGATITMDTSVKTTNYPQWNQNFKFGTREWIRVKVSVLDHDRDEDDILCNERSLYLPSTPVFLPKQFTIYCNNGDGKAVLNYTFF